MSSIIFKIIFHRNICLALLTKVVYFIIPKAPVSVLTVLRRSSVVVLCFGVRVSMTFLFMFVHIIFISVWIAEWPPFGKELITRLT